LRKAVTMLGQCCKLLAASSVWETRPLGVANQPNYLNAAALIETNLTAAHLKANILAFIEKRLGRVRRGNPYGPRTIDVDLVLFNRDVLEVGQTRIPHPEVLERPFVAIPLAEIAPNYRHPETGQTLSQIAGTFRKVENIMQPRPDITLAVQAATAGRYVGF